MSQRTLHWPRRIARTRRQPLTTGHGSFCLQRIHLGDDAFESQRVQLGGYLLVLARAGSVILDGDKSSLLLQEGDAAIIPPGQFKITEIPRPHFTRGETLYWFFNQRALADLVARREGMDELAARIRLPALSFYPARRMGVGPDTDVATASLRSLTDLRAVFNGVLHSSPAIGHNFLKHHYFATRFKLCVWVERLCHGPADVIAMAQRYPQGARTFYRECSLYLGMPVSQWIFRRKIEIAQAWLRHSDASVDGVAARLGFDDLRMFRGYLKRFGQFSPLELEVQRRFGPQGGTLAEALIPSWFPSTAVRVKKARRNNLDHLDLWMTTPKERDMRALLKKYSTERCQPSPATDGLFLTNNPVFESVQDSSLGEETATVDKIINLELVERWQLGTSCLAFDSDLAAIAA